MRSSPFLVLFIFLVVLGGVGYAQTDSVEVQDSFQQNQCSVPEPNSGFVAVAGGWLHSLGLRSDYSIVAWGSDDFNQCTVTSPASGFISIATGFYHSLGLRTDSSIAVFGQDDHGQCVVPEPNTDFVAVAGGGYHSLGLKADSLIVAWGDNAFGQCDVPETDTVFVAVAGGGYHSLGLKADGSIVAWGDNSLGQCDVPEPDTSFVAVAAGMRFSLGLISDGSIVAWGDNTVGQCTVPDTGNGFIAIAGGGYHGLGLRSDGSIVAWGDNEFGQCNVPDPNTGFVAVTGGMRFSLGVKADGSIVAWGIGLVSQEAAPELIHEEQEEVAVIDPGHSLLGATFNMGTLGIGGDVTIGISDQFNGRLGFNLFNLKIIGLSIGGDDDEPSGPSGPSYPPPPSASTGVPSPLWNCLVTGTSADGESNSDTVDVNLQTIALLIDWHPGGGGFRLTTGMVINGNKMEWSTTPGDTVSINDHDYAVESLTRILSFNSLSPYLGIGTGNAVDRSHRLHFAWDLGVIFHGKPKYEIEGTAFDPSMQGDMNYDMEAEQTNKEDDLKAFIVWPVLTFGLSYTF